MNALALLMSAGLWFGSPAAACPPPLTLGRGSATVAAFLDPVAESTRRTFLELRRLVHERPGHIRVEVHWVSGGGTPTPAERRARAWLVGMANLGAAETALALLRREGPERLFVRLSTPQDREILASEIGVPPAAHEGAWNDACAAASLHRGLRIALEHLGPDADPGFRAPRFTWQNHAFEDGPELDELRMRLGMPPDPSFATQAPRGSSSPAYTPASRDRLPRPGHGGVVLGGPGLPHWFLITPRSEDDPVLSTLLPPALEFRSHHPGRLAVYVVARGAGLHADRLRHRLCAAALRGLSVPYVRWLAGAPAGRPDMGKLLETLDAVPERDCPPASDPADFGLPEGAWLDGIPRSRGDLETLAVTLDALDRLIRPLTPWLPRQSDGIEDDSRAGAP